MPPIHTTAAPATVAPDPMDVSSLPPAPAVSKTTRLIAGLLVDVYGLAELSGSQSSVQAAAGQQPQGLPKVTRVSVLWLHHARGRQRQDMADIAARAIGAWQEVRRQAITTAQATGETGRDVKKASRGLIAVAFDQRNHGTRAVSEQVAAAAAASDTDGKGQAAVNEYSAATQARVTNAAWRSGNPWHAQDMFGVVAGCVVDTSLLMDALEGYVDLGHPNAVDHHLVLGVSLGGHSAWQTLFAEERIRGGVVVIGCPDLMQLFTDRARKSKLATWKAEDNGRSFLGSKDFPPSLVAMALKCDPKGILFGTGEVANPTGASDDATAERARLRRILDERLRGKRILLCSGADDKLVPYECAEDMVDFLRTASETWYRDGDLVVDNRVYDGIGHVFAAPMIQDAVRFLTDTVAEFDDAVNERTGKDAQTLDSKM